MPCPYFQPDVPTPTDSWARPPRLPLGEAFSGVCRAPGEPLIPSGEVLMDFCNRGYCRPACTRFPDDAACDAMRYSIAEDRGLEIEIHYIFEKDYSPVTHGRAVYNSASRCVDGLDGIAGAQMQAFAESYNRRKIR